MMARSIAREALGFIRGGMLFLERPHRWRFYDRAIWRCCGTAEPRRLLGEYCIRQQRAGRTEIPRDEIAHVHAGIVLALEMTARSTAPEPDDTVTEFKGGSSPIKWPERFKVRL